MEQKNILFGIFVFLTVFVFLIGGIYATESSAVVDSEESEESAPVQFVAAQQTTDYETSVLSDEPKVVKQSVTVTLDSGTSADIGSSTFGYFLMGTDEADAVFWGTFNSATRTLQGEVSWYGNPSIRRVGVGSYSPTGSDSGSLSVHFSDPNNSLDPGLNWTGTYGKGRWIINNTQNSAITLSGRVFQAPL